jgi:hypothetical protein
MMAALVDWIRHLLGMRPQTNHYDFHHLLEFMMVCDKNVISA